MEKIILLEATAGTVILVGLLILYTRAIKKRLRKHILRNEEMQKYLKER